MVVFVVMFVVMLMLMLGVVGGDFFDSRRHVLSTLSGYESKHPLICVVKIRESKHRNLLRDPSPTNTALWEPLEQSVVDNGAGRCLGRREFVSVFPGMQISTYGNRTFHIEPRRCLAAPITSSRALEHSISFSHVAMYLEPGLTVIYALSSLNLPVHPRSASEDFPQ